MSMRQKDHAPLRMISDVVTDADMQREDAVSTADPRFRDPIGLLRSIGRKYRLLSKEAALELGRKVQEEDCLESRNLLVLHNVRLAISLAYKYRMNELEMSLEDRVQEAIIGLTVAADKFDYRLGYSFTTYAYYWIYQSMSRALQDSRSMIREPVHLQELRSKVRRASEELTKELKRPALPLEIATRLNIEEKQVIASLKKLKIPIVSLDATMITGSSKMEGDQTYGDNIADDSKLNPLQMMEAKEEMQAACNVIESLIDMLYKTEDIGDRNKQMFTYYYGLDGPLQGRTLDLTGEKFDVTRERIRQIVANIWDKFDRLGLDLDHDRLVSTLQRIKLLETLTNETVSME